MKPDEVRFLVEIADKRPKATTYADPFATDIGVNMGIHIKRVVYLLNKWADKGWWEYGVSLRTGWLTPQGLEAATKARAS